MEQTISLSVVVLVFNEEASLECVIKDLLRVLPGLLDNFEVLIVDDGSRDRTAELAARLAREDERVSVCTLPENRGLPAAAKTGYRRARGSHVVWIEGDGQFKAEDLGAFLKQAENHNIVASYRERIGYSWTRRTTSRLYNFLLNRLFDLGVRDAGSVIMVKKGIVDEAELLTSGVAINAELLLRAKRKGHAIGQCPRAFVARAAGTSRIFGAREIFRGIADVWRLYRALA